MINKTSLENEIKNLIIYKKALFNADDIVDFGNEVKEQITSTYDKMKEVPLKRLVCW